MELLPKGLVVMNVKVDKKELSMSHDPSKRGDDDMGTGKLRDLHMNRI